MDDRLREIDENGTIGMWPASVSEENAVEDEDRSMVVREQSFMVKSHNDSTQRLIGRGLLNFENSEPLI